MFRYNLRIGTCISNTPFFLIKSLVCDPNIFCLWQSSVGIYKTSLLQNFPNFLLLLSVWSFLNYTCKFLYHTIAYFTIGIYAVYIWCVKMQQLFHHTSKFARNIFYWYKNLNVLEKNGGWGCGSLNGPLRKMVPIHNLIPQTVADFGTKSWVKFRKLNVWNCMGNVNSM